MSSQESSLIVLEPLKSVILARKVAATKPCPRELLVEYSTALVSDANERAKQAFAKLERK